MEYSPGQATTVTVGSPLSPLKGSTSSQCTGVERESTDFGMYSTKLHLGNMEV